jgi:catechol 2,3-dioxygenase-like lactoylglutathione lyase family enzyme
VLLNLNQIGQIGLPVSDVDRSEAFYETVIGLRKLYRFGDLTFFDCAGVRLLLSKPHDGSKPRNAGASTSAALTSPWRSQSWSDGVSRSCTGRI